MARLTLIVTILTAVFALLGGVRFLIHELRGLRARRRITGRWLGVMVVMSLLGLNDAQATDTYVATTGNNANACGAGIDAPKATLQDAHDNCAGAGNAIVLRAGTYTQTLNVTTGGTPGNPYTIKAHTGETPVLDGPVGETAGFNVTACNITINGLEIKEFTGPPSGQASGIYLAGCSSNTSVTTISNNHIHHITGVDNPAGVKFAGAYQGTVDIFNNLMHDSQNAAAPENNAGVMFFGDAYTAGMTLNLNIRNNDIHTMGSPVFFKHAAVNGTINMVVEKNLLHGITTDAQAASGVSNEQRGAIIRGNAIYAHTGAEGGGVGIWPYASSDGDNSQIYNNCFYNVNRGMRLGETAGVGLNIHDNIFETLTTGGQGGVLMDNTLASRSLTLNFNNYAEGAVSRPVVENYSSVISFATLQALGYEASGRTGASGYVNPAGTPPDFHLTAGSANRGVGTGGADIGCYPTETEVIGIDSGDSAAPATVLFSVRQATRWLSLALIFLHMKAHLLAGAIKSWKLAAAGYAYAGQRTFQWYWRWKVNRWLRQAPVMIEQERVAVAYLNRTDKKGLRSWRLPLHQMPVI